MDLFWVSIYFNGIFFWILRPQGIGNWSLKRALAHTCAFGRKGGPRGTPKPPKFVIYIVKLFLNSKFWVGTFIKSCSKGTNWYIKFSFHKGWGTYWAYRQGQTFNFTLKLVVPLCRKYVLFYFSHLFLQLRDAITKNLGKIGLKLSLLGDK
jgi:hypothetical protein